MVWTEQTASSASYEHKPDGALWNNGTARWNVSGNIETVIWNRTIPTYTEQTGATATWTEV